MKKSPQASTASYLDVSMLSQPSRISGFRLRREVIYNIQNNEWKKSPQGFHGLLSGCFNALSAVGRGRTLAEPASGYGARLSKTSKFEEWKGTTRKFVKSQSRMFQCSLSRRKRASFGGTGFRLRREVIITHFSLLVIFLYLYPLWRFKKIVIGQ